MRSSKSDGEEEKIVISEVEDSRVYVQSLKFGLEKNIVTL